MVLGGSSWERIVALQVAKRNEQCLPGAAGMA